MRALKIVLPIAGLLCLSTLAQADVFNLGPGLTNLETEVVGDPGNTADTRYVATGRGAVDHTYAIGKYEVTAAQYCDFLNHKAKNDRYFLYSEMMWDDYSGCKIQRAGTEGNYTYSVASDYANRPVNWVSYWDACRFVNWLHNGQGDGDTENGAYTLSGSQSVVTRNAGAKWYIATQDEWYKAAYYSGNGVNSPYWDYATQSNTKPSNDIVDPDPGNSANFYDNGLTLTFPYYRTNVGEFENSSSHYGTFDQSGNVWEWTESESYGWIVGGSFSPFTGRVQPHTLLAAFGAGSAYQRQDGLNDIGFRVAAAVPPVPEPSSLVVVLSGFAGIGGMMWRRSR